MAKINREVANALAQHLDAATLLALLRAAAAQADALDHADRTHPAIELRATASLLREIGPTLEAALARHI